MGCPAYSLVLALLFSLFAIEPAKAEEGERFFCGGSVESEVWDLWDVKMRDALRQRLLQERLLKQGDVYALYDFQSNAYNLVSMAQRCKRTRRLMEVARLIRTAYDSLEPDASSVRGRQWICHGGTHCKNYGYLDKEVRLNSAQFLALAALVANAMASSDVPLGAEDVLFIKDTIQIVSEHLLRWGDEDAIAQLVKLTKAKPGDVRHGPSRLGFVDFYLWQITMYAELAGLRQWQGRHGRAQRTTSDGAEAVRMRRHLNALLLLFSSRISIREGSRENRSNNKRADLDQGYWRLDTDTRYAGYEGAEKPVICAPEKQVRLPAESVPLRDDIGWDISHARRLVHALDALERNRQAVNAVFPGSDKHLNATAIAKAFAANLVGAVWNQSMSEPLFSNYTSGANGWYHAKYDARTGKCSEGHGPYGLSEAFVTGGYITWAKYYPVIGLLGQKLHDLAGTGEGQRSAFMVQSYRNLSASGTSRDTTRLMFLPSLVGIGQ